MGIFTKYYDEISPSWLNDPEAKKFKKAFDDSTDQIITDAKTALNQMRIDTCDNSALDYHRRSSSLLAGKNESFVELRKYLKDRWAIWKLSGARNNIIRDLGRIGYKNCKVWSWLDLIYSGATRAFGGGYAKLTDGSLAPTLNRVVEYIYVEPNLKEYNDYYAYDPITGEPAYLYSYYVDILHVTSIGSPIEATFIPEFLPATNKFVRNKIIVNIPCDDLGNPLVTSKQVADYINLNGVYDPFSSKRYKSLMCNVYSNGIGLVYVGSVRATMPQTSFFFVDIGTPNGFLPEKKWNAVTDTTYISGTKIVKNWIDYLDPVKSLVTKANAIDTVHDLGGTFYTFFVADGGVMYYRGYGAISVPWTLCTTTTLQNLNSISGADTWKFACGNNGTIIKGIFDTWSNDVAGIPPTTDDLLCIYYASLFYGYGFDYVYACGKNGTMLWRNFTLNAMPGTWAKLSFFGTGLTATTNYYGVVDWEELSLPGNNYGAYYCGYDPVASEGILAFFNRSTANLYKQTIPVTNKKLNAISAVKDKILAIVGDDGLLMVKEDGIPWRVMPKLTNQNLTSITIRRLTYTTFDKIYVFGDAGVILEYDFVTGINKQIRNLVTGKKFLSASKMFTDADASLLPPSGYRGFAAGSDAATGNALIYGYGDETVNISTSKGVTPLVDGALWDDKVSHWDIQEPYNGAIGDIINVIKKWKPAASSCRYISIRVGDRYISVPMHENFELDAYGTSRFDFYNHSFSSDPEVEYKKLLNSIYYRGY